jgi:hypothetical protein
MVGCTSSNVAAAPPRSLSLPSRASQASGSVPSTRCISSRQQQYDALAGAMDAAVAAANKKKISPQLACLMAAYAEVIKHEAREVLQVGDNLQQRLQHTGAHNALAQRTMHSAPENGQHASCTANCWQTVHGVGWGHRTCSASHAVCVYTCVPHGRVQHHMDVSSITCSLSVCHMDVFSITHGRPTSCRCLQVCSTCQTPCGPRSAWLTFFFGP